MTSIILPILLGTLVVSSFALTSSIKPVFQPTIEVVPIIDIQQTPSVSFYLGQTYNPFIGNPLSSVDPGLTGKNIFEFTQSTTTTKDGNFAIPKEVVEQNTLTYLTAEKDIYSGLSGYTNDLFSLISYKGGISDSQKYFFTKSADYQNLKKSFDEKSRVAAFTKYRTSLYSLAIKRNQKISKDFIDAVEKARVSGDWKNFVNTWGVYYTTKVFFGAATVQRIEFFRKDIQDIMSLGFSLPSISQQILNEYQPVTYGKTTAVANMKYYRDKSEKITTAYNIGAAPKSAAKDWATAAAKAPAPVGYHINYIGDLFTLKYMGQYDDKTLASMKAGFEAAINSLFLNGDTIPKTDVELKPTKMLLARTIFYGGAIGQYSELVYARNPFQRATKITLYTDNGKVNDIGLEIDDGQEKYSLSGNSVKAGKLNTFVIPAGKFVKSVIVTHVAGYAGQDSIGLQFVLNDGTKSEAYGSQYGTKETLSTVMT